MKAEKPTDPRHRPTQDLLEHVFREARGCAYGFQGRDAKAVAEILRLSGGDTAEIERRWRIGLNELGFRRSDSIHDLATKWNAYAGTAPRATSVRKVTAGSGAAEDWKLTEEERSWANTSRKA